MRNAYFGSNTGELASELLWLLATVVGLYIHII